MKDRAKWEQIIKRWRESGLSQTEFCRREKISMSSFYNKKSVIEKSCPAETFVEVGQRKLCGIEIIASNGVTVRVPHNIGREELGELVRCLG